MIEIIHISDLHFGKSKAWTKRVQRLLRKILAAFPFQDEPDVRLLITGDVIHNWGPERNAWKKQFKTAEEALEAFASKVSVVPGNHDYGFGGFGYIKECSDYFDTRFLPALGIRHHFGKKQPFHEILDDGKKTRVQLIGLNSCLMSSNPLQIAKGEVGEKQRTRSWDMIRDPRYRRFPKIVYLHHIPHRRARGFGMSLTDYEELMTLLEGRADALAFGHEGAMKHPRRRGAKQGSPYLRSMKVRRTGHRGIKYYLDANACVEQQSCYHIKVVRTTMTARLVRF